MVDPCLTFYKEVYYKIRKVLEGVEISVNDRISIVRKLN